MVNSAQDALAAWQQAWKLFIRECRQVLGSELHYQAMIYHAMRTHGKVPLAQIGMNVKMLVRNPRTAYFKQLAENRHKDYQIGYEPVPDVVVFAPGVKGDWRRRKSFDGITHKSPHTFVLLEMEIKASERYRGRVTLGEIQQDILKLVAHREEINLAKKRLRMQMPEIHLVVVVVDTAPGQDERMTKRALASAQSFASDQRVHFCYVSPDNDIFQAP